MGSPVLDVLILTVTGSMGSPVFEVSIFKETGF
jgi:hypothetical protein